MGNSRSVSSLEVMRPSRLDQWVKEKSMGEYELVRNTDNGLLAQ